MPGKLIFVSGLTGAGKTTLVSEALKRIENLEVLLTYTTRPKRSREDDSYEYIFVDEQGYEENTRLNQTTGMKLPIRVINTRQTPQSSFKSSKMA